MTNEMNVDAVRLMRELRERLDREFAGKTFQEQKRIIRERLSASSPAAPAPRSEAA